MPAEGMDRNRVRRQDDLNLTKQSKSLRAKLSPENEFGGRKSQLFKNNRKIFGSQTSSW